LGLLDLFRRRRPQARAHPSNLNDPDLIAMLGGGMDTAAGIAMNETAALSNAGVWAAVKTNAETGAMLPKHVFRRTAGGDKVRDFGHSLQRVIHVQANPIQSAYEMWSVFFANLQLRGSAYAQIIRNAGGDVSELWPIPADKVAATRQGDRLSFTVRTKGGAEVPVEQGNMLYIHGFRFQGERGINPIQIGKDSLALGVAMEKYGSGFFARGGRLSGILEIVGDLSEERQDAIANQFDDAYGSVENAHKTLVAKEGTKYHQMSAPPNEGQLLEGRTFQIQEAARRFSSTPSRLQDHSRSTFKNVEQQNIEYVQYGLQPMISAAEGAINTQLFTRDEQDELFVEFNVDALLRGDTATRYAAYASAIQHGWMSRNEVRDRENLNPIEGGDELLMPVNMTPISEGGTAPAQDGDADTRARRTLGHVLTRVERADVEGTIEPRRALRRLGRKTIEDAARRLVRAELRQLRALVKKHIGRRSAADLQLALEEFYGNRGELPEIIAKTLGPVFEAYALEVAAAAAGEVGGAVPELGEFVEKYAEAYTARHAGSHLGQLLAIMREENPEDQAEAIETRLAEWEAGRNEGEGTEAAEKIGDREAVKLGDAIAGVVFAAAGVTSFIWIANAGACPICNELDGRVVGREQVFVESGDTVTPESGDAAPLTTRTNVAHPPLHQGCDCTLAAA